MSTFEDPRLLDSERHISVDDVRELTGATTPHFAMHVRQRLQRLVRGLAPDDPARQLAELEMGRLERLAVEGERGHGPSDLTRLADEQR